MTTAGDATAGPAAGGRRERLLELARFVPDCAVLCKRLLTDPRVPLRAKVLLVGSIGYAFAPFDLVPDFVPWLGELDDVVAVAVAAAYVERSAGRDVVTELWPGTEAGLRAVLVLAP
jgi:uncharacterized membrane protein YkvA (DUF1232 family)